MIGWSRAANARYLSVAARGDGESTPVLFGSNPLGAMIVSSGIMSLAGASAASMVPVLPLRICGIDVRETLRRLDAAVQTPTAERGVTSGNRLGEPLAVLAMRWMVAPDGFEATPSAVPPTTELDLSRSQRFVMRDGVIRFQDRAESGMRFFGAGRTYPFGVGGTARTLFAGAAVVVEGLGVLKGLRGSLTLAGEVRANSFASLTVTGRFDDDGPLETADRLGVLIDTSRTIPASTVLSLAGESDGPEMGGPVEEGLRVARIDNDLTNASRPRSAFHLGAAVGRASGPVRFDPSDRRCSIRLTDARREFAFTDADGQAVGRIVADGLEGTAFHDAHAGEDASRLIAYGPLSRGSGALAEARGVVVMDAAISPRQGTSSLYTLFLIDDRGRYQAAPSRTNTSARTVSADDFTFVRTGAGSMSAAEREVLAYAERTLAEGGEVNRWFQEKDRAGEYGERFDLANEPQSGNEAFGFFDVAPVGASQLPVMGVVQEMFFDRHPSGNSAAVRAQLEEFALRYFMRVAHVRERVEPDAQDAPPRPEFLRALSWIPDDGRTTGSGYHQLYYRLRHSGPVGRFPRSDRGSIVDLREIGTTFDWVVMSSESGSLDLTLAPLGSEAPTLRLPMMDSKHLIVGPELLIDAVNPDPGVLGEYGFGYAYLPYSPDGLPLLAYGRFRVAVESVKFRLMADGEIRVRSAFVISRPDRIADVDLDPIGWSVQMADLFTFRMASRLMSPMLGMTEGLSLRSVDPIAAYIWMANAMTLGMAERRLGISKAALEKRMLLQHLQSDREMLRRTLGVWRMVPDWTDREALPDFCRGSEC